MRNLIDCLVVLFVCCCGAPGWAARITPDPLVSQLQQGHGVVAAKLLHAERVAERADPGSWRSNPVFADPPLRRSRLRCRAGR